MVPPAFPLAKLSIVLIKHISKPISNAIKENAKRSPTMRKHILHSANMYHWMETQTLLWKQGRWRSVKVKPLPEEKAVELGANLLGEAVLFSTATGALVLELTRQSHNKTAKEKNQEEEFYNLADMVNKVMTNVDDAKGGGVSKGKTPEGQEDSLKDQLMAMTKWIGYKVNDKKKEPEPTQPISSSNNKQQQADIEMLMQTKLEELTALAWWMKHQQNMEGGQPANKDKTGEKLTKLEHQIEELKKMNREKGSKSVTTHPKPQGDRNEEIQLKAVLKKLADSKERGTDSENKIIHSVHEEVTSLKEEVSKLTSWVKLLVEEAHRPPTVIQSKKKIKSPDG